MGRMQRWQDCVAADSNVLRARQLLLLQKDAPIHHILEAPIWVHPPDKRVSGRNKIGLVWVVIGPVV